MGDDKIKTHTLVPINEKLMKKLETKSNKMGIEVPELVEKIIYENLNENKPIPINRYVFEDDEYFDLIRIQEITEYILNMKYDNITLENIKFIQELYDLFFNIISFKINLIKKYDFKLENKFKEEYLTEYLKFKKEFQKRDYYFLENILNIKYHNKKELIDYCKFMKEQ